MEVIIASNNKGKIREYKEILEPMGYTVLSQNEAGVDLEVEETGTTFEENAALKARAVYDLKKVAVLADDSGLEVDYLNKEPGIYSARYMGLDSDEARRRCIIEKLEGVPEKDRTARFVCTICFINEIGKETVVRGDWEGIIGQCELGNNGFGYDPIFIPLGDTRTLGQLSPEEKNTNSHRAIAIQKLKEIIEK